MQPHAHREQFEWRQIVVQIGVLGHIAEAQASTRLRYGSPEDARASARRFNQPHQDLDRRRLAGAIGADEAKGFAGLDGQRNAAEGDDRRRPPPLPVVFFKTVNGDRGSSLPARSD
jgi:hypothetical protein